MMMVETPKYLGQQVEIKGHLLRDGFVPVNHALIRTQRLTPYEKLVLILLLSRANKDGGSWPGHDGLAENLGINSRTVLRALARLRSLGLVTWERRGQGHTNLYVVHETKLSAFIAELTQSQFLIGLTVSSRTDPESYKEEPVEEEPDLLLQKDTVAEKEGDNKGGKTPVIYDGESLLAVVDRGFLEQSFPGVDLAYEAQKCVDWWLEGGKKMKRPRVAFTNWLENVGNRSNGRKATESPKADDPQEYLRRYERLVRR